MKRAEEGPTYRSACLECRRVDIVERARVFATNAHDSINHRRRYTGLPYVTHLANVVSIVSTVTQDSETLAVAWLHDTVEDTRTTLQDITIEFGESITDLVRAVTDVSKPSDGNRAVRREIDRRHLAKANPKAKTVKLADLIDNCLDICRHDHRFARVYLKEMAALLMVLHDGNSELYKLAALTYGQCSAMIEGDRAM
jgi:(p)ppGpp synthase/HD superfamily hydrolase